VRSVGGNYLSSYPTRHGKACRKNSKAWNLNFKARN